ncbi:uncharacterized protein [Porites lutea]|uniref:uncharacterized protein n=1 Tax=Porites lutea TaxID=51062 RepID=UPI003CC65A24
MQKRVNLLHKWNDKSTQTLADQRCSILSHEMELLKGQLSSVRQSLKTSKDKKRQLKRKVELLTRKLQEAADKGLEENVKSKESCDTDNQDTCISEEKDIEEEEEPDFSSDAEYFSESRGDTEKEDEEKETNDRRQFYSYKNRIWFLLKKALKATEVLFLYCTLCAFLCLYCSIPLSSNNDIRTEPKHIVFLSKLLLLFQFCHFCRTGNKPDVTATQSGTAVTIRTTCSNPGCRKEFTWTSQPLMSGTKLTAGNFLICMATLFAGGSFTKMKTIFQHKGLACVSLNTFFKHQRTWLFPTVHLFWKRYQANLFSQLKVLGDLTIAGDGRHDSMGHCAKYGAYTIFCCTLPRIIHFALVQGSLNCCPKFPRRKGMSISSLG